MENKLRIIIADDSDYFIEGIRAVLEISDKYELFEVHSNGLTLVNSKNLHMADIILIDINMPKLNGIEAAKKIDFQHGNIPLVAVTMNRDDIYLKEIIGAGFRGFVYKPDVASTLFDVLDRIMNQEFVFPDNLKI